MKLQKITITEKRGIIDFGEATINNVDVYFAYNSKADKFTAIAYNYNSALVRFPAAHNQKYLVGRCIATAIKSNKSTI